MTSRLNLILGVASIGDAAAPQARFTSPEEAKVFLEAFRDRGYRQLDTARVYPAGASGTSEKILGQVPGLKDWAVIDSKVVSFVPGSHSKEKIASSVDDSLQALGWSQLNIEYLHAPDRHTPLEETCGAINEAYRAGKFRYFGISNYTVEEVEQIMEICTRNGWVKPSVYQGIYNAVSRHMEDELLPVLRKHEIGFYAYSPAAGGFFSGKISRASAGDTGSRWDAQTLLGQISINSYFKDELFKASERLVAAANEAGMTGHAAALRWVVHHSQLKPEYGDAVLLGASSVEQLKSNLDSAEAGPLPDGLRAVFEELWPMVKDAAPPYWMASPASGVDSSSAKS